VTRVLLLLALAGAPVAAWAQAAPGAEPMAPEPPPVQPTPSSAAPSEKHPGRTESPIWGSFQFSLSGYRPNIDSEFGGRATPFGSTFGSKRGLMFRGDVAKSLFTRVGTVEVGVGAGYWEKYGHGEFASNGAPASESTAMKIIPLRLTLTYRFDYLATQYGIPFAPYARVELDRYQWWVLNGSGQTANANGTHGTGGTNGYSFAGGIALQLDFFDREIAREMDNDLGINHCYLFADFMKSYITDFGSSKSWNLSDDTITIAGGILFVF